MKHSNRVEFSGILGQVDVASTRAPDGARGHRVLLSNEAAEQALPGLLGMGVNAAVSLSEHDTRRKVGVITSATVADGEISVSGYLWGRDFPEVIEMIHAQADDLGLSWEVVDARVRDIRADVWELSSVKFVGVSCLKRNKAAYSKTSIWLDKGKDS